MKTETKAAIKAIIEKDFKAIKEMGTINPVAMVELARIVGGTAKQAEKVLYELADNTTLEELDAVLYSDASEDKTITEKLKENGAKVKEKAAKAKEEEKAEEPEEDEETVDYTAMTTKKLIEICKKNKIKVLEKGRNKQYYLDKLTEAGIIAEKDEDEADFEEVNGDEDEVEESTETEVDYNSMSEIELFKECKKLGIPAEKKKKKAYYIELLEAANEEPEDDEDEDWGDEDEEEQEEVKQPKNTKKTSKKEETEDDEDWSF